MRFREIKVGKSYMLKNINEERTKNYGLKNGTVIVVLAKIDTHTPNMVGFVHNNVRFNLPALCFEELAEDKKEKKQKFYKVTQLVCEDARRGVSIGDIVSRKIKGLGWSVCVPIQTKNKWTIPRLNFLDSQLVETKYKPIESKRLKISPAYTVKYIFPDDKAKGVSVGDTVKRVGEMLSTYPLCEAVLSFNKWKVERIFFRDDQLEPLDIRTERVEKPETKTFDDFFISKERVFQMVQEAWDKGFRAAIVMTREHDESVRRNRAVKEETMKELFKTVRDNEKKQ